MSICMLKDLLVAVIVCVVGLLDWATTLIMQVCYMSHCEMILIKSICVRLYNISLMHVKLCNKCM